jgi:REP element-mobilizing transposase RayT
LLELTSLSPSSIELRAGGSLLRSFSYANQHERNYVEQVFGLWSPSYFASSCGGAPISIVRQYIEQQQTPH